MPCNCVECPAAQFMQDYAALVTAQRDKFLLASSLEIIDALYGSNRHNRSFEQLAELEIVAERQFREWRGVSLGEGLLVLAHSFKKEWSLQADTMDGIFKEFFSPQSVFTPRSAR
jgi:hypothetical protein